LAKRKGGSHLYELAKRGAETRFRELLDELRTLTLSFPHLRDSFDADELPISFILKRGAVTAATRRRRRKMSAEGRERIRQAQLKRWARQKTDDKKK
jgi:hypothetical protein